MEQKLALANCITLLYNDNALDKNKAASHNIIKNVLDTIVLPDAISDGDVERKTVLRLKILITELIQNTRPFDLTTVLQEIRIGTAFDPSTYAAIKESIVEGETEDYYKKEITSLRVALKRFITQTSFKAQMGGLSFELNKGSKRTLDEIAQDMSKRLKEYTEGRGSSEGSVASLIGRLSTGDREGFKSTLERTKEQLSGKTLKCGWQDVNAMLGINNGIIPGELITIPALPHNAKTTFSLALFISFALFNDAADFMVDDKPPLLFDVTLENDLEVNIPIVYRLLKEHETGEATDIKNIDPDAAADYICEVLGRRGWHVIFDRHNSTSFTIETFDEIISNLEEHYTVVAIRVDYLGVSNKRGLGNGSIGSEVREMYRWARNIANPRKIALISPHQLSPEAKRMRTIDPLQFVRNLPGKGLYDGCTTVDNEVDLELYIGITDSMGKSFLEIQRGKHRTLVDTPQSRRYVVYAFHEVGCLPWDMGKKSLGLKSVSAGGQDDLYDL